MTEIQLLSIGGIILIRKERIASEEYLFHCHFICHRDTWIGPGCSLCRVPNDRQLTISVMARMGMKRYLGFIDPTLYLGIYVATSGKLSPYYDWGRPHQTQSRQLAPWETSEVVPSERNPSLNLDCNTVNYALWHPWISESALKATWSLPVIATYCKLVAANSSGSEVIWDFCLFVHSSSESSLLLSAYTLDLRVCQKAEPNRLTPSCHLFVSCFRLAVQ